MTNRGALRLCTPIKTRWKSVFECINRALQSKDAINRFSENDREFDGRINGKDDEDMSDGNLGELERKWCA